jgi:fumarate reductase iron-sulfur subunit
VASGDGTLSVSIWRGDGAGGAYRTYEAPAHESQTVLDVVAWVQQNVDPTLAYRYACRVGMCGSCAMTVNGVPRWTCRTHVAKVARDGALEVGPLRNLPVIRDLATDMDPFFGKWVRAGGSHEGSADRADPIAPVAPDSRARREADAGVECINCGVCYAACDTVAGNPDYLGPAALLRAWTVYNDAREADRDRILRAVSGAGGCHNCHSQGSCVRFCPNGLDPLRGILGLKRATARAALKGTL